ncbi:MAG: hypothetical protein LCH53_14625, partial [Bacteroidetes bacterium]|nr:hypothetical protein [Bacteroidota bacterium]
MRCIAIDNDHTHGGEIVRRWGMENPPPGWSCERVAEGLIGDTVAALLASPGAPRMILYAYSSAHLPAWREAWTYALDRGCLVVTSLGSNTPGATGGPARLPSAYVTVGADDPVTSGEDTSFGAGMWMEAHPYDSADYQSWAVATAAAALARAYEAVASFTPEPGCDRWTLAIRAVLAGASGPRAAGQSFVTFDPRRGFGLVTHDTVPVVPPPVMSPLLTATETTTPGKVSLSLVRLGGIGVSVRVDGEERLQTADDSAALYLPSGTSTVEARALLAGGGVTPAHQPGTLTLDVPQGYVPPAPALEVQRQGASLLVVTEAEGATGYTITAQAGAETPTEVEGGEVVWPAHLPARVVATAVGAGGTSGVTVTCV